MTDGLEIKFPDMPQFQALMDKLGGEVPEIVCRRGMRAGGQVVQAAVTAAAPVRPDLPSGTALPPGALAADIELHVTKERDGSISAYIEPGKYTYYAARLVEYGHDQYVGRKKKGGALVRRVAGKPWFRPAYEASEVQALWTAEDAIAAEIEKQANRLGMR